MADVINFQDFKDKRMSRKSLCSLSGWLHQTFDCTFRLRDFPDEILLHLAEGGAEGNSLLDNLILGVWGYQAGGFRELSPQLRMRLLDVSLLLIDQLRFECMMRLGWIEPLPVRDMPLLELILAGHDKIRQLKKPPQLRADHPHYHRFQGMMELEKETFVRRQIPAALEQFHLRLKPK